MKKGVKLFIAVITVCFCILAVGAQSKAAVKLDEEHFSQQLLNWFTWRDTNEDGYLSDSELKKITELIINQDKEFLDFIKTFCFKNDSSLKEEL